MFCKNCGNNVNPTDKVCSRCGTQISDQNPNYNNSQYGQPMNNNGQYNQQPINNFGYDEKPKSKLVAGLLGIFVGSLGVHNFYLGYTGKAITQLIMTVAGTLLSFLVVPAFAAWAAGIWGLIEGILILVGNINVDGKGNQLSD